MGTNIKGIKNMTLHLTHNQYSFLIRDSHEDPSNDHNLDFKIIN